LQKKHQGEVITINMMLNQLKVSNNISRILWKAKLPSLFTILKPLMSIDLQEINSLVIEKPNKVWIKLLLEVISIHMIKTKEVKLGKSSTLIMIRKDRQLWWWALFRLLWMATLR
jgi:hypothetical protein